MRSPMLLVSVLFIVPFVCSQEKPAKLAELRVYSNSLYAEGVFRPDNLTEKTELAFDAVTRIECYRNGGVELVNSNAYCMQATASIALGDPMIEIDYFPVITWDSEKVIAADSATAALPICTWTQITVNLHDHSVMATDTKKLGKGHEGFNNACDAAPLAQTYHLMDKIDELVRRKIRAAQKNKDRSNERKCDTGAYVLCLDHCRVFCFMRTKRVQREISADCL